MVVAIGMVVAVDGDITADNQQSGFNELKYRFDK
jgi:hypothetical protein